MAVETEGSKAEFARRLASAGYEDFLILERDTAERVLTERRLELVDELRDRRPESTSDLADRLDRDVAAVHRDLDTLFEFGLVSYDVDGSRKRPRLKHEHAFVEPVL